MSDGLQGKAVGSSGGRMRLGLDQKSAAEEREPLPEEAVRPEGTALFGRSETADSDIPRVNLPHLSK